MGRESLWLVYIYVHPKVCHSFHYPVSPLPLASLFSSHYQRSIIIMRNSSAERGGGRGGGGATTTLNFTSKLNPAEVKWRHGSFVRAFRFEPWYYRGGKRSNNIISITDFHAGLIIEPSVSIVTYDEGRRRRRRKGTFSSDHDVHLISVLIDDRDLYIYIGKLLNLGNKSVCRCRIVEDNWVNDVIFITVWIFNVVSRCCWRRYLCTRPRSKGFINRRINK